MGIFDWLFGTSSTGSTTYDSLRQRYSSSRYRIETEDNSVGGTNGQYDDITYRVIDTHTGEVVDSAWEGGKCDNR
jgi:hypothetical protein